MGSFDRTMASGARILDQLERPMVAYPAAAGGLLLAFLVRLAIGLHVTANSPLAVYFIPILACGLFLGLGPALFGVAVALAMGIHELSQDGLLHRETVYLTTFALVTLLALLLTHFARTARGRAAYMQALAEEEAESARRSSEELDLLVASATDYAIFMVDGQGRVTLWNEGARRIFGWTDDEVMGRHIDMFYAPEEVEAGRPEEDQREALVRGGFSGQVWQIRRDGSEFLADLNITPLSGEAGEPRGFGRVLRDVTDRFASEQAVERRERHLRSILETVPDAMVVVDEDGVIIAFSAAAQRMFGYGESELIGRSGRLLLAPQERDNAPNLLRHQSVGGEAVARILNGARKNEDIFPMEVSIGEAVSGGERVYTVFVRDLTEKQGAEAKIEKLQSELIHVSRLSAMGTMASTLAHELNQPLTAIANYAEAAGAMVDSTDPEDMEALKEIFAEMSGQSVRAGRIVRRLREFIARGEVEKRTEDLPGLIAEAGALALVGAREKGVSVTYDLSTDATPVLVDRVQIQQVLINLMRNAVEAMEVCDTRKLSIRSTIEGDDMVRVTVTDSGPGIAPDIAANLFQAFVTSKETGMGLGLSICRTIIEAHGGRIEAFPAEGGGTTFTFTLVRAVEMIDE